MKTFLPACPAPCAKAPACRDAPGRSIRRVIPRWTALAAWSAGLLFGFAGWADDLVEDRVDWPAFLGRHDLVWESLPRAWHEGAFLGNGLLGAMIYAPKDGVLQWDVGRSDVVFQRGRIALGRFVLEPGAGPFEGTVRLDLWNAEARGVLRSGTRAWSWRSLVHTDRPVVLVELEGPAGSAPSAWSFHHEPALPARLVHKKEPIPPSSVNPEPERGEAGGLRWLRQPFVGGGGYTVAWGERTAGNGRRLLAWTVDFAPSGTPDPAKALGDVRRALDEGYDALARTHRAWWQAYYPQSFLSLPDTRMESFYWIQQYKLAAGTRADRPALDLMGPWFRSTPWPMIWWNLNIQLTYWPVYAANRLSLGESLTRMLDAGFTNLVENVPEEYRADAAAIGRTSSYDCRGGVGSGPGRERGNLTWALHNYWLQYRHAGDEAMLRDRLYPLLKRAAGYYLHILEPGPDGVLHLPVSLSPEYPKTAPDTNYDLSLLRWALQTLLAADARLGLKDPDAARWKATLEKLAPYPVDPATGYMIGAGVPLAQSHRHFSHLLMVYPLHLVDPESAADRPLIEQSLDHWIGFEGALQGYSFTGSSALSSWLGRTPAAVDLLNAFLDRYVKPNTMYLESGPVIETPLSAAASIHELVLQSWCAEEPFGTHLRVFPAVPDSWPDAVFHRLLAEGAFEVSAFRRAGRTRWVRITSLSGAPCRVRTGLAEPVVARGARAFEVRTGRDRNGRPLTTVDLRKGETVLLTSAGHPPAPGELVIEPLAAQPGRENVYGSPKTPPVSPGKDGAFVLTAAGAARRGEKLLYQAGPGGDSIGRWIEAGEFVTWNIRAPKAGRFRVSIDYAATGGGSAFAVEASPVDGPAAARLEAAREGTGGWDMFKTFELGTLDLPEPGPWTIAVRSADGKPPYLNLHEVRLTPAP